MAIASRKLVSISPFYNCMGEFIPSANASAVTQFNSITVRGHKIRRNNYLDARTHKQNDSSAPHEQFPETAAEVCANSVLTKRYHWCD